MPTSVLQLKALIWAHAVFGVAIFFGLCLAGLLWRHGPPELLGLAFVGLVILWLLGIVPLRRKAATLPEEAFRSEPPPIPKGVLRLLAVGQFLNVGSALLTEYAFIIVPIDVAAAASIIAFVMVSDILSLPMHRDSLGELLAILFLGTVWNGVGCYLIIILQSM